jgi:hypothetical protein
MDGAEAKLYPRLRAVPPSSYCQNPRCTVDNALIKEPVAVVDWHGAFTHLQCQKLDPRDLPGFDDLDLKHSDSVLHLCRNMGKIWEVTKHSPEYGGSFNISPTCYIPIGRWAKRQYRCRICEDMISAGTDYYLRDSAHVLKRNIYYHVTHSTKPERWIENSIFPEGSKERNAGSTAGFTSGISVILMLISRLADLH